MPIEALIETHIDEAVRLKAEAAFAAAGLTIDEAFIACCFAQRINKLCL